MSTPESETGYAVEVERLDGPPTPFRTTSSSAKRPREEEVTLTPTKVRKTTARREFYKLLQEALREELGNRAKKAAQESEEPSPAGPQDSYYSTTRYDSKKDQPDKAISTKPVQRMDQPFSWTEEEKLPLNYGEINHQKPDDIQTRFTGQGTHAGPIAHLSAAQPLREPGVQLNTAAEGRTAKTRTKKKSPKKAKTKHAKATSKPDITVDTRLAKPSSQSCGPAVHIKAQGPAKRSGHNNQQSATGRGPHLDQSTARFRPAAPDQDGLPAEPSDGPILATTGTNVHTEHTRPSEATRRHGAWGS